MPGFREEWTLRTLLRKDGEPSFQMECRTLQEAFVLVRTWTPADQARARFWVDSKDKGYSFRFLDSRWRHGHRPHT
jgi:hypothetical protein